MGPEAATLPGPLAELHARGVAQPWLARFTLMNRLLLAMAFVPTGLVKLTGQRFTTIPVDDPIGFFFEAMYQTGPYWHFIGGTQVAAGVMLLIPTTATLGAIIFVPVILSIALITWGVGFGNTVWVTAAMLLSVSYLLCWDADRIWRAGALVLGCRDGPGLLDGMNAVERTGWLGGGLVGMAMFLATRGFVPMSAVPWLFVLGLGAFGLVVTGWALGALRRRRSAS